MRLIKVENGLKFPWLLPNKKKKKAATKNAFHSEWFHIFFLFFVFVEIEAFANDLYVASTTCKAHDLNEDDVDDQEGDDWIW